MFLQTYYITTFSDVGIRIGIIHAKTALGSVNVLEDHPDDISMYYPCSDNNLGSVWLHTNLYNDTSTLNQKEQTNLLQM